MKTLLPIALLLVACGAPSALLTSAPAEPVATPAETSPAPTVAKGTITGTVTSVPATAAKNAVIYLEDGPKDVAVSSEVENGQMSFYPYVAVVTVGGSVKFVNDDPFPHSVFSPDNERFDIGEIAQYAAQSRTFDKPGAYTLRCNLHPNMKGYVVSVPSNAFAKADQNGTYTIKDVPPGTYKMTAWAPGVKTVTHTVTVLGEVTLNFDLHR